MRGKFISGYLMDNKHMPAWIILLVFILLLKCCLTLSSSDLSKRNNWLALKMNHTDKQSLLTHLKQQNLTLKFEITPSTYIFEYNNYNGHKSLHDALKSVLITFSDQVIDAEVVRIYEDTMKPWDTFQTGSTETSSNINTSNLGSDTYYGKDVTTVWSRGYGGKGVTVAITGVGIETKLLDLQRNINPSLCFNFVTNQSDVTPEHFSSIQKKALQFTDHGNRIASVIAADRDNHFCSSGISYASSIVGIKMFAIRTVGGPPLGLGPIHWSASDIISRALVHKLDDIDIFVNAWTPVLPFDPLDLATREAIMYGATMGRHGLGTIHVVPAGTTGNILSNSIYTLTVGMLGVNGTVPGGALADASVLTSGLSDGSNLTSSYWVTTSHLNKCITSFKGYSAAVSQVAGIIALGLEANPMLSLRDIQHLLVISSDHSSLKESSAFKQNAAGYYFHEMFGFGLLNAEKFVSFSGKRKPSSALLFRTLLSSRTRIASGFTKKLEFCYSCDVTKDTDCLTTIEHVVISADFNTSFDIVKMEIMSPADTRSVVIQANLNQVTTLSTRKAKLVSVHFWNEAALGGWTLTIQTTQSSDQIHLGGTSLTLYGTRNEALVGGERVLMNNLCKDDQPASTVRAPAVKTNSESPTKVSEPDEENKPNLILLVVLPVGVVVTCGIMAFIILRGNHHGPVSSYGKPIKKAVPKRHRHDSELHRQISLLRQKSRQDSTSEDIEGEMSD